MRTGGKYLLDTNTVIRLMDAGFDPQRFSAIVPDVFVSVVTIGELHFGARKSARVAQNLARLEQFAREVRTLGCDLGTAREYGIVRDALRAKGTPIPANDMWIAATARQHGLVLVTSDSHFAYVDGLATETW